MWASGTRLPLKRDKSVRFKVGEELHKDSFKSPGGIRTKAIRPFG